MIWYFGYPLKCWNNFTVFLLFETIFFLDFYLSLEQNTYLKPDFLLTHFPPFNLAEIFLWTRFWTNEKFLEKNCRFFPLLVISRQIFKMAIKPLFLKENGWIFCVDSSWQYEQKKVHQSLYRIFSLNPFFPRFLPVFREKWP